MNKDVKKLKLYVDFDCTLVDTIASIVSLYNEDFKYYKKFNPIDPNDVNTWDFTELECATPDYINTYFNQSRFFNELMFMPYANIAMNKLSEHFDIVIVSHGYSPNLRAKEEWIFKHLPGVKFIGVNLKHYKDKSCVDMSDGFFVDDGSENLRTSNAIKKYCFGKVFPWNEKWTEERFLTWEGLMNRLIKDVREIYE